MVDALEIVTRLQAHRHHEQIYHHGVVYRVTSWHLTLPDDVEKQQLHFDFVISQDIQSF